MAEEAAPCCSPSHSPRTTTPFQSCESDTSCPNFPSFKDSPLPTEQSSGSGPAQPGPACLSSRDPHVPCTCHTAPRGDVSPVWSGDTHQTAPAPTLSLEIPAKTVSSLGGLPCPPHCLPMDVTCYFKDGSGGVNWEHCSRRGVFLLKLQKP